MGQSEFDSSSLGGEMEVLEKGENFGFESHSLQLLTENNSSSKSSKIIPFRNERLEVNLK